LALAVPLSRFTSQVGGGSAFFVRRIERVAMNLSNPELKDLVIEVAAEKYGTAVFRRRPLMLAVESRVRALGAWTAVDDVLSSSRGEKSDGLAKIDWAISHLSEDGRLANIGRDRWRLPQSQT
jgi:hypothetical protein